MIYYVLKCAAFIRHRKEDNYGQDYWYRFRYNKFMRSCYGRW